MKRYARKLCTISEQVCRCTGNLNVGQVHGRDCRAVETIGTDLGYGRRQYNVRKLCTGFEYVLLQFRNTIVERYARKVRTFRQDVVIQNRYVCRNGKALKPRTAECILTDKLKVCRKSNIL